MKVNIRNMLIFSILAGAWGCATKIAQHDPDHVPGLSCPRPGHGSCPFECTK